MSERVIELIVTVEGGQPVVTPHQVVVTNQPTLLYFRLKTAGHSFPENHAIEVTDPGCDFPYSSWTLVDTEGIPPAPLATRAVLFDANQRSGTFSYTVNVITPEGARLSFDPSIENQAR